MMQASAISTERGDEGVTPDHLLLAILRQENSASTMLGGMGIDYQFVIQTLGIGAKRNHLKASWFYC